MIKSLCLAVFYASVVFAQKSLPPVIRNCVIKLAFSGQISPNGKAVLVSQDGEAPEFTLDVVQNFDVARFSEFGDKLADHTVEAFLPDGSTVVGVLTGGGIFHDSSPDSEGWIRVARFSAMLPWFQEANRIEIRYKGELIHTETRSPDPAYKPPVFTQVSPVEVRISNPDPSLSYFWSIDMGATQESLSLDMDFPNGVFKFQKSQKANRQYIVYTSGMNGLRFWSSHLVVDPLFPPLEPKK